MKLYTSKRSIRERFEFIETKLFWGNGLTAGELGETFDISRPAAQKVIDDYRKTFPGQMAYDPRQRRHTSIEGFEPVFIRKDPLYFLDYLRGQSLTGLYREEPDWSEIMVTDADRLLRPKMVLEIVKPVFHGLLHQKVISIDYQKKNLQEGEETIRSISPNHIVFADDRYHIRAYCHKKDTYLDFVLSRIVYSEISKNEVWVSSYGDREWNEYTELHFKPNPDLPESMRSSLLTNYDFQEPGIRKIKCRKSLSFYIKNKLLAEDMKYKKPLWVIVGGEEGP